jgi:FkbM family methyltransferase
MQENKTGVSDRLRSALFTRAIFRNEEEQAVVGDYFRGTIGVFVEVGAYQPIEYSQTYHLEQLGWSGILIEPLAEHAQALRTSRRARVFEVACGAPEHHGASMPIRVSGGLSTFRNTRNRSLLSSETRSIRMVTLDSILGSAGIEKIDLLSIDVEGIEVEVLRGFDIRRFQPRLVLLEDMAHDFKRHRFMRAHGYKRVRRTGNNSWYVRESDRFPISLFGRFQLLRKYCLSVPLRLMRDRKRW